METMRIGDVESGAAEDARQVAHQIEMRQIRSLAQLGVAQAIAARLDLGKTGERPGAATRLPAAGRAAAAGRSTGAQAFIRRRKKSRSRFISSRSQARPQS